MKVSRLFVVRAFIVTALLDFSLLIRVFITCRDEIVSLRKMKNYSQNTEREPQKEILIVRHKSQNETEKRSRLAQRAADDGRRLQKSGFLLADRLIDKFSFQNERNQKSRNAQNGEDEYQRRIFAERRAGKIKAINFRLGKKQNDEKQQLRDEQREPEHGCRSIFRFDAQIRILHF